MIVSPCFRSRLGPLALAPLLIFLPGCDSKKADESDDGARLTPPGPPVVAEVGDVVEETSVTPLAPDPATDPTLPGSVPEEHPAPVVPPVEGRPELGFANRVPTSAEGYVGFYQLDSIRAQIAKTAFWSSLNQLLEQADTAVDMTEFRRVADALLSQEFGVVLGEGSGEALRRIAEFGRINDRASMKALGGQGFSDVFSGAGATKSLGAMIGELESVLPLIEGLEAPAISLLFHVEDAPELVASLDAPVFPEDAEAELGSVDGPGGHPFTTLTVRGKDLLDAEDREALMDQDIDEALADRLVQAIEGLEWSLSYGALDDTTVALQLGSGPGAEALSELVAEADKSIASLPALGFAKDQAGEHSPVSLTWARKKLFDSIPSVHPMSALLEAVDSSLTEIDGMEELSAELAPKIASLVTEGDAQYQIEVQPHVGVGWLEDGYRYESRGGVRGAGLELGKATRFELPKGDSTFLSMTVASNSEHVAKGWTYFENLVSVVMDGVRGFESATTAAGGQAGPMSMAVGMEGMLSPSFLNLYQGTKSAFLDGLGDEMMFSIDLDGRLPALPNMSERMIADGPIPQITFARSVSDREALGGAWGQIVPALNGLLGLVPSPTGGQMKVPEFVGENIDGAAAYRLPLPIDSDSVLPSLLVFDEVCFFGTSYARTQELVGGFGDQVAESGGRLYLNFGPLVRTGIAWAELARDGEIPGTEQDLGAEPDDRDEAAMAMAMQGIELIGALGEINHRFYDEEGQFRTSLRWLFRDIISTN